jgi:uncharacterized protein (TIGR02145 family)
MLENRTNSKGFSGLPACESDWSGYSNSSFKIMRKTFSFFMVCFLTGLPIINSCSKEEKEEAQAVIELPSGVITEPVTAIASYKAIARGIVYSTGGTVKMICGVCWSTKPDPDTSCFNYPSYYWIEGINDANNKPGPFTTVLHRLLPNTTYYIRAFAFNEAGITYGNQLYFNTLPDISDHEGNTYGIAKIGSQTLTGPGCSLLVSTDPFEFTDTVGTLYNWHTVSTGKLCPAGWHVPTDAEWLILPLYVGSDILCSGEYNDYQGTHADVYFFNAPKYSSIRDSLGIIYSSVVIPRTPFQDLPVAQWWSSTPAGEYNAWYFILDPEMMRQKNSKKYGLHIRCIKD